MEKQDFNKEFHLKLNTEFIKIEKLIREFRFEFIYELSRLIKTTNPDLFINDAVQDRLLDYANRIFSCAESVYDKDRNYSEIRLKNELTDMTRAIEKYHASYHNYEIAEQTNRKAKEMMVHFFPELMELSGNGFRLLEKYCLLYNYEFISSLEIV